MLPGKIYSMCYSNVPPSKLKIHRNNKVIRKASDFAAGKKGENPQKTRKNTKTRKPQFKINSSNI